MAELTTSEVSKLPTGFSHLLAADELLRPGWSSSCITLCGQDVRAGDASPTAGTHCPGCECEPHFCPDCVREACQWSTEP